MCTTLDLFAFLTDNAFCGTGFWTELKYIFLTGRMPAMPTFVWV